MLRCLKLCMYLSLLSLFYNIWKPCLRSLSNKFHLGYDKNIFSSNKIMAILLFVCIMSFLMLGSINCVMVGHTRPKTTFASDYFHGANALLNMMGFGYG